MAYSVDIATFDFIVGSMGVNPGWGDDITWKCPQVGMDSSSISWMYLAHCIDINLPLCNNFLISCLTLRVNLKGVCVHVCCTVALTE